MSLNKNPKHRLLLIEDSEPDKVLAIALLEKQSGSVEIDTAGSLQEAHALCKKKDFDLVILDLNLPDGYGVSNVETVKSFCGNIPIVALTALQDKVTLEKCVSKGAKHVMTKETMLSDDFADILRFSKAS